MNESVDEATTKQARWWLVLVYVDQKPPESWAPYGGYSERGKGSWNPGEEDWQIRAHSEGTAEGALELHQE